MTAEPAAAATRAAANVLEPAALGSDCAGSTGNKQLKSRAGFTSSRKRASERAEVKPANVSAAPLIVGFDAEWVEEPPDPDDNADDDGGALASPPQQPRNRILSYQLAARAGGKTWSWIAYTAEASKLQPSVRKTPRPRHYLALLLAEIIKKGIVEGHLSRWPQRVILAAHWTRADLSALADYATIKRQFDSVHKTYVTRDEPYRVGVTISKHRREFDVYLVDTQLLAPGTSKSLAALGDLHGFKKLQLGQRFIVRGNGDIEAVPYIVRMDWLLQDDPSLFEQYAIRDAEICARHVDKMMHFVGDELGLSGSDRPPVTLGSLAVRYLLSDWKRLGIDAEAVLGRRLRQQRRYNSVTRRYRIKTIQIPIDAVTLYEPLAKAAFYGGRNECFGYGPTIDTEPERQLPFREYDVISAYATALASLGMPDYERAIATKDLAEFRHDKLGFARIRFRFARQTRFPSLPVIAADDHGLIYPLEGETYATAPEIAVARHFGADIDILDGVVIPWREDRQRPFREVIADLGRRRDQHPKGSLQNEMFKQLANSIYGKLGQGLKDRKSFNTRTDRYDTIGPSKITCAFLAAHVTGLIRALISELIASIPATRQVISVTTDGFITNARLDEISLTGPVAAHLADARRDLTGDPALLESKFEAWQVLPWRTRGIATLKPRPEAPPKLARGGMREPRRMSLDEANDWFARAMLLRHPGDRWSSNDPLPFPEAHRTNADFVKRKIERTVNFEYDMKRRPLDPEPSYVPVPGDPDHIVQHMRFGTTPWRSVDEFNEYRERFERWRQLGCQLKTIADWWDWENFGAGADASKAGIRRSPKGPVDQARRLFLRAYVRQLWGLQGGSYKEAAARLTSAGYATTAQDFKNALRGSVEVPEHLIARDAPGIPEFIAAVRAIWPEFECWRLISGSDPRSTCAKSLRCAGFEAPSCLKNREGFTLGYDIPYHKVKPAGQRCSTAARLARLNHNPRLRFSAGTVGSHAKLANDAQRFTSRVRREYPP